VARDVTQAPVSSHPAISIQRRDKYIVLPWGPHGSIDVLLLYDAIHAVEDKHAVKTT
jgi:hypothetical protein